jgi:hypothetical protein
LSAARKVLRAAGLPDFYWSEPGLPDGFFSNQKSQFESNLEGLGIENAVTFYDHLEYFTAIWYIYNLLVYFSNLATLVPKREKYTKGPQTTPNGRTLHHTAINYTKWPLNIPT